MFPVLGIAIIDKANLSSFNIKFKNCYSLSASHNYKSIRLRNKSQRGFTVKGYLAGELLRSLVSQDFHTSTRARALSGPRCSVEEWIRDISLRIHLALRKSLVLILLTCVSVLCFRGGSQSNVTGRNANYVVTQKGFPADVSIFLSEAKNKSTEQQKQMSSLFRTD